MPSYEFPAIKPDKHRRSLEDAIRSLNCSMVKTLDQQLDELRKLAEKIEDEYGIDLLSDLKGNGVSKEALLREFLERFIRLANYIDSLR
jgi:hypothetical protein